MPFQFSCLSATERRSTAAKRDDLHSKSLFLVKNKGQWNAKSGPKANKIFGTFGVKMRACGQKLVKFCTLTHAAKLVVRIGHIANLKLLNSVTLTLTQICQPLRFVRNYYNILLPLRLLRYMSRSLRQRRIPNSPKNSCCKRLKQAVAANRVISENKTCTLLNILPPLVIHISSFPLTSSLCVAGWPNFGGSAYCIGDWLTESPRILKSRARSISLLPPLSVHYFVVFTKLFYVRGGSA